jgi:hypothetical protein
MPAVSSQNSKRKGLASTGAVLVISLAAFVSLLFFCWSFLAPGVAFWVRQNISQEPVQVVVVEVPEVIRARPLKLAAFLKRNVLPYAQQMLTSVPLSATVKSEKIIQFETSSDGGQIDRDMVDRDLDGTGSRFSDEIPSLTISPYVNPVGILEGVWIRSSGLVESEKSIVQLPKGGSISDSSFLAFIDFGIDPGIVPVVRVSSSKKSPLIQRLVEGKIVVLTAENPQGLTPAFRGALWGRLINARDALALVAESMTRKFPVHASGWLASLLLLIATAGLVAVFIRLRPTTSLVSLTLLTLAVVLGCKVLGLALFGERVSLSVLLLVESMVILLWLGQQERRRASIANPDLELALVTERELAQEMRSFSRSDSYDRVKLSIEGCFPGCSFIVASAQYKRGDLQLGREFSNSSARLSRNAFLEPEIAEVLRIGVATILSEKGAKTLFDGSSSSAGWLESLAGKRIGVAPVYHRAALYGVLIVVAAAQDTVQSSNGNDIRERLTDETSLRVLQHLGHEARELLIAFDGNEEVPVSTAPLAAAELLQILSASHERSNSLSVVSSSAGWSLRYSAAMRAWLIRHLQIASDAELPRSLTELLAALLPGNVSPAVFELQRLLARETELAVLPCTDSLRLSLSTLERTSIDGIVVSGVLLELVPGEGSIALASQLITNAA